MIRKDWIFIFCEGHEEGGSENVHAFTNEGKFITFVNQAVEDCVDDLPARIQEAKLSSNNPVFVHTELGWGGPHIFVVLDGNRDSGV